MHAFVRLLLLVVAVVQCSRLHPRVVPLIVRNPYLSTWLPEARDHPPWDQWPMFWTGEAIGFSVLASIPAHSQVFPLLGRPHDSLLTNSKTSCVQPIGFPISPPTTDIVSYNLTFPKSSALSFDASTTNLTFTLLSSHLNQTTQIILSFASPITPTSTLRQALPAGYLTVYVTGSVQVNIYIDLNGQWVSGDRSSDITWNLGEHSGIKTWRVQRSTEQLFTEYRDRAEWGTLCFSGPSDVQHEAGTSALLRQRFANVGALQNRVDDKFRGIMNEEPVFAFSKAFHANTTILPAESTQSATFTIAHIQDPVVQFAAERGLTLMRPLWASYFQTVDEMLAFHYADFNHATALAAKYSAQLALDAYESGAEDYVDIVALSARQVLGATSFSGTPSNPILFLKEISSNGNFQTVDVIFPSIPFFLYTNPRWLAYLLEPLIEHMLSGQYPGKSTMHDLGFHFPNATGHPDGNDEYMPVEECGNILIMALALVQALDSKSSSSSWSAGGPQAVLHPHKHSYSGMTQVPIRSEPLFPINAGVEDSKVFIDGPSSHSSVRSWVRRGYPLFLQWTQYLIDYSLRPENQLSTDDFAGWLPLQTGLALKGIIGINAMAELARQNSALDDAAYFSNISTTYITLWEEYALSRDKTHAKVAYNWYGSWTTLYNLYADALLCFPTQSHNTSHPSSPQHPLQPQSRHGFVPRHIYQLQSNWYHNVRQRYGVPLDSRHLYTKTDWEFFSMAIASPRVRAEVLQSVAKWVNETSVDRPLTDLHDTEGDGGFPGPNFFARPVVGGHFAFLALEGACGGKGLGKGWVVEDPPEYDVTGLLEVERRWGEGEEVVRGEGAVVAWL